jgi:hypothetical protein
MPYCLPVPVGIDALLAGGERWRAGESVVRVPVEQVSRPGPASISDLVHANFFRGTYGIFVFVNPATALFLQKKNPGLNSSFVFCRVGVEKLGG